MSVNRSTGQNPPQGVVGEALSRATEQRANQVSGGTAPQAAPTMRRGGVSAFNLDQSLSRGISRRTNSELLSQMHKAYQQAAVDTVTDENIKNALSFVLIDSNTGVSNISIIVATLTLTRDGVTHTAMSPMLLEGSLSGRPNSLYANVYGENIEIPSTTGDYVNNSMWDLVSEQVRQVVGAGANLHRAAAFVVPASASHEDVNVIRNALFFAVEAAMTVLDQQVLHNYPSVSLRDLTQEAVLQPIFDFGQKNVTNPLGRPIRADVSVLLRAASNQPQQTSHQLSIQGQQQVDLTRVDGYIDLEYVNPQQQMQPHYGHQGQMVLPPAYVPRLVITQADTQVSSLSLGSLVLAIASTMPLAMNYNWAGALHPSSSRRIGATKKSINKRDVGAVGLEYSFAGDGTFAPIATDNAAFGDAEFIRLITTAFSDRMMISMDIDEAGPLTFAHEPFAAAANGFAAARDFIIQECNNLTNGVFGQIWDPNDEIVLNDKVRIHLGTFLGEDGQRHDIREFDYLAALNITGAKNPEFAVEWQNTYTAINVPEEKRLKRRQELLMALGDNLDIRLEGYARRVTFTGKFIERLNQAIQQCGVSIRPATPIIDFTGQAGRAMYAVDQAAFNTASLHGVYSGTGGVAGPYRGIGGMTYSRYGG